MSNKTFRSKQHQLSLFALLLWSGTMIGMEQNSAKITEIGSLKLAGEFRRRGSLGLEPMIRWSQNENCFAVSHWADNNGHTTTTIDLHGTIIDSCEGESVMFSPQNDQILMVYKNRNIALRNIETKNTCELTSDNDFFFWGAKSINQSGTIVLLIGARDSKVMEAVSYLYNTENDSLEKYRSYQFGPLSDREVVHSVSKEDIGKICEERGLLFYNRLRSADNIIALADNTIAVRFIQDNGTDGPTILAGALPSFSSDSAMFPYRTKSSPHGNFLAAVMDDRQTVKIYDLRPLKAAALAKLKTEISLNK